MAWNHSRIPRLRIFWKSSGNPLKNTIREEFPKVEYLQEFIPLHESREYLFNYFQKQGFQKFGEVEFPEWSNHPIQQVRTPLTSNFISLFLKTKKGTSCAFSFMSKLKPSC